MSAKSQCVNPTCLVENPLDYKFCHKCGSKLLLADHFRSIRYLGEGGFGRTFLAIDEHRWNTPCVVKQFLPAQQGSSNAVFQKCVELFTQESLLLKDLGKHPQIPDLIAFFEQDGRLYLIQDFIEGQDLLKEFKSQGPFSQEKVAELLFLLLPVLTFIHGKNVIHRDIKPENIIRQKNGLLVLIDFGVSKQMGANVLTRMGTVAGSFGYSPPEQMRGMVYPSSDLYSLAVTAIRLLTGCFPFEEGGRMVDELYSFEKVEWQWKDYLTQQKIKVNEVLIQVLDRMLQEKATDRFASANDALLGLKPLENNQFSASIPPAISTNPSPIISSQTPIPMMSEGGINYSNLNYLLQQKLWKEADKETARIMLAIMEKISWKVVTKHDMNYFPCEDLTIIDRLWKKHSNNHFGLSIQRDIWQSIPGMDVLDLFGDRVGWRDNGKWLNYDQLNFTLNAPKGHLPILGETWGGLIKIGAVFGIGRAYLFPRVSACGL